MAWRSVRVAWSGTRRRRPLGIRCWRHNRRRLYDDRGDGRDLLGRPDAVPGDHWGIHRTSAHPQHRQTDLPGEDRLRRHDRALGRKVSGLTSRAGGELPIETEELVIL